MTTKLAVVELLLDRAEAYAADRKFPHYDRIPALRKKISPETLVEELQARCFPPFDAGCLADYVEKEALTIKTVFIAEGFAAAKDWIPSAADKAFFVDILTKIIKVLRTQMRGQLFSRSQYGR